MVLIWWAPQEGTPNFGKAAKSYGKRSPQRVSVKGLGFWVVGFRVLGFKGSGFRVWGFRV